LVNLRKREQGSKMPLWLSWFLRRFTKHVMNPVTLRRAGGSKSPYAALHHVGRTSNRLYVTPLVAEPVEEGFVIPLPYGEDTDWCRNLVAAGKGTLDLNGETFLILNPRVVSMASVREQVRAAQVRSWTRLGLRSVLLVDRSTSYR
jgi:deazaflavin-dependent oxidoreductase (nitroreductase family)